MKSTYLLPAIFIAVVAAIIFLTSFFSKKAVVKRKLKKMPARRISEFMSGETAKVVGEVEIVGDALVAPLSGRPCAYYYVLVEELRSHGKGSSWHKIIEEEERGSFVLRDGRSKAFIQGESNIKSYIVPDVELESGFMNDATEVLEQFLNKYGYSSEGFLGMNKSLRFKEGVLEPNEKVAVAGQGEWAKANSVGLPDDFGKILVLRSGAESMLYLSDDTDTLNSEYDLNSY